MLLSFFSAVFLGTRVSEGSGITGKEVVFGATDICRVRTLLAGLPILVALGQ